MVQRFNFKRLPERLNRQFECTRNVKWSLLIVEDSAETYLCLIEEAIEVVWFELKGNTTETKLRECVAKRNINLTKNEEIAQKTEHENYTNNTEKGKHRKCKRDKDMLWSNF